MKYFFPFLVITSQLQKIKIDEKLNRASINELFSREPQIFTQSNGQKSLSGLMSSNNRDVLKWCIDYSKILPPHQRIFRWLMRKIPIRRKSFSQCTRNLYYRLNHNCRWIPLLLIWTTFITFFVSWGSFFFNLNVCFWGCCCY